MFRSFCQILSIIIAALIYIEGNNYFGEYFQIKFLKIEPSSGVCSRALSSTSILFREIRDETMEGWIPIFRDEVPGFDHVALLIDGLVYEMHPGYGVGTYYSRDGADSVFIENRSGLQWQHTVETFRNNSRADDPTSVLDFASVPISRSLAEKMRTWILSVQEYRYMFVDQNMDGLIDNLSPCAQKGGDHTFTCVGIIEWAAEMAGYKDGQGFIPDDAEYIKVPDYVYPNSMLEIPVLSPQLMFYALKMDQIGN